MCLSLTPTGVTHAVDLVDCPQLPAGQQRIALPLPGAPAYRCAHPCGGACRFVSALPPPPPLPEHLRLRLRLAPTLAALVAAALATSEPAGTADDAQPSAQCDAQPCLEAAGARRCYLN